MERALKPVIEVKNVNKSFGENHVLRDFSMEVVPGENLVILGKSGSGKSVLIKCIIKLMQPDSGQIVVLDEDINDLDQEELDKLRAKVGFLFQLLHRNKSKAKRNQME